MVFEVIQIVIEKLEYFLDITNIMEWSLYVFTILFVYDLDNDLPEVSFLFRFSTFYKI